MLTRNQILLKYARRDEIGLEIGPSHNPIAKKSDGFNVKIIDHLNKNGLIDKYKNDASVDVGAIEEVDYVWSGGSFANMVRQPNGFSWIIASHVIEHVPDLVSFLRDCEQVMKKGGVLALAIPDKRYCFDRFRSLTSLGAVIDAHHANLNKPTPGTVLDFFLNYARQGGRDGWSAHSIGSIEFAFDDRAVEMMRRAEQGDYVDVHSWCFTPSSFRLLIHDLKQLGLISIAEVDFVNVMGSEFFVFLGINDSTHRVVDRMRLLHDVEKELALASGSRSVKQIYYFLRKMCFKLSN